MNVEWSLCKNRGRKKHQSEIYLSKSVGEQKSSQNQSSCTITTTNLTREVHRKWQWVAQDYFHRFYVHSLSSGLYALSQHEIRNQIWIYMKFHCEQGLNDKPITRFHLFFHFSCVKFDAVDLLFANTHN